MGQELFAVFPDLSRIVRYPDVTVVRLVTLAFEVAVEDFGTLRRSEESEECGPSTQKCYLGWMS